MHIQIAVLINTAKINLIMSQNNLKKTVYSDERSLETSNLGNKLFMLVVTLYILIDLTEKLIDTKFEIWIYAILFAVVSLSLAIIGISLLESLIMNKLNS